MYHSFPLATQKTKLSFCLTLCLVSLWVAASFIIIPTTRIQHNDVFFSLNAKKKKTLKKGGSGGGFGGAAMEPCPCGSTESYSRCCGKLHKDVNAYKSASAEQIVRARYSAYAKRQAEFLMATTHPLHKDFNTDLKQWKDQIKLNMYDNFDLKKCIIVEDEEKEETASVKFVAELELRETGEVTGFMETSQFERAKTHGGWLYKNGTMEAAPEDLLVKNLDTN